MIHNQYSSNTPANNSHTQMACGPPKSDHGLVDCWGFQSSKIIECWVATPKFGDANARCMEPIKDVYYPIIEFRSTPDLNLRIWDFFPGLPHLQWFQPSGPLAKTEHAEEMPRSDGGGDGPTLS